jgi:hypothetical protein
MAKIPVCCQCTEMATTLVDLFIHHHGSFSKPDLEYVGGDVMPVEGLDADSLCFGDIATILEVYMEYTYHDIPRLRLYYKYDDESNDYIRGFTDDKDMKNMLKYMKNVKKNILHIFVNDVIVEELREVPIKVRSPVMMISQSPVEVYVEELAEEPPQEHAQEPPENYQAAKRKGTKKKSAELQQNAQEKTTERKGRHKKQIHTEGEDHTVLSDFEETDGEEDDIFVERDEERIRQAKGDIMKWFQSWYETETSKNIGDNSNEPNEDDGNSDGGFSSIDSDDVGEGSPRRARRKYPQWMEKANLKEIVELYIGQEFVDPGQFKGALQLFAIQNSFDYTYMHNEKTRVTAICKKTCGWRIHASWSNDNGCFQIKTYIKEHNCGTHYYNKRASIKWAAHRYLDNFRDQPNLKPSALKEMIRRDYNVEITLLSCNRVKRMALDI